MNTQSVIPKLTIEEYSLILENSCANLFATDGTGKIIYSNMDSVAVLECPLEQVLTMNIYELREQGYVSYSMTDEVLRTGKKAMGTYFNKSGREVVAVSTPVHDAQGAIRMVITYSRQLDILETFNQELQEQRERVKMYQSALEYFGCPAIDSQVIVKDPAMIDIFQTLGQVASTDSTVMLYGESGVGKEVLASFIRQHSLRKDEMYVPLNCATIPHDLIESELFGYEKGAFTGANKDGKAGLFELASGGTLFLDEIGELPAAAQAKLLRVMESGDYRRIGSEKTRIANVRIIGATNRDLKKMVERNEFRADLYYRLNVMPVSIPPLRMRPLEIDAFADLFLRHFNRKHHKNHYLSRSLREAIHQYSWPGNIRELRNVIERYVITGDARVMAAVNVEAQVVEPGIAHESVRAGAVLPLASVMADTEKRYIIQIVKQYGNDVGKAAEALGICKSGLYAKLKRMARATPGKHV